ncbi:hypothetical protein [Rhodopseudomonas pseudopalustris]|uniref:Uncharacterized protein n=1 Tax=Rhodopseudomonas pseudopalustris TaxID=1513892 RepID=A0A1H8LRW6_9BRAD|nr:hypothetical protein [Rhodopseudomonas pseudopalustris]SEO07892.1 hypothetical protein SAMN05444123_101197 [Rhodopseudomonas pseudopalustris]
MLPLLLAGAGAGSTLLSSMFAGTAQDEVNNARLGVNSAERARQQALDMEASGINSGALNRYAGFGTLLADRATKLSDMYRSAVGGGTALPGTALPASSSDVVNREIDNKQAIAQAFGLQQGDARGKLQSFGDLLGTISRSQARDAGTLGQIGGYKKGSAGVQALELDAAGHAGDSNKLLADLFGGFGKAGLNAGLSQMEWLDPGINPDGSIIGAAGPTSIRGRPLIR